MDLILLLAVLCLMAGIGVQYDDMPSNDGAGKALATVGGLGVLVVGGMMWGAA